MGTRPLVRIEECGGARVVSFRGTGKDPEDLAWASLREWAVRNLNDYSYRKCIGFAPRGHHPEGQGSDEHDYLAQMYLFEDEGQDDRFLGAEVTNSPAGLFLVSDVPMDIINTSTGHSDIGEALKRTSRAMWECLESIGGYELDLTGRTFVEEHVYPHEWFQGANAQPEFRLWLPIRRCRGEQNSQRR